MNLELKKVDYIVVFVQNMTRSIDFYRKILQLPLRFSSPEWTEFETGETTLALHGLGDGASPSANPNPKRKNVAGAAHIGFQVPNVQTVYEHLQSKGVNFSQAPTERPGEGILLAVAHDPDGLEISFSQPLK